MKKIVFCSMAIMFAVLLSSCGRVFDWISCSFYQAHPGEKPELVIGNYIRSVIIHDQFSTLASFDFLWLSPQVRAAYVHFFTKHHGKDAAYEQKMMRQQQIELEQYISFYLLVPYAICLHEPDCPWAVLLKINDHLYQPAEIKIVELSPEYQFFFGNLFTRFKKAYLMQFVAHDSDKNRLITSATDHITIDLRSIEKKQELRWDIDQEGKVDSAQAVCIGYKAKKPLF